MAKLNPIEYLIDREFFARPKPHLEDHEQAIHEFRMSLLGLTKERLAELVKEEQQRELFDRNPFNTPMHWPDYEHWRRMSFWYLDEATALSLGLAPERVSWDTIEPMVSHLVWSIPNQYQSRRELVLRAAACNQITDPIEPNAFLAWADRVYMKFPDELRAAALAEVVKPDDVDERVLQLQAQVKILEKQVRVSAEKVQPEHILSKKEARSLYKLILGMAVTGYRWNPADKKSEKPAEIAGDCELEGLSIDADTVRKWLRKAVQELRSTPES